MSGGTPTYDLTAPTAISIATAANVLVFIGASASDLVTAGHPSIVVTNRSTVVTAANLAEWLPAFQYAVSYQFAPSWGSSCHLLLGDTVPKGAWQIVVLDTSDQAGALGYHDETPDGYPLGKIFAKTDVDNGYSITVTFTHELFEMLADPDISRAYQTGNTEFTALEVGDPVEADRYGYTNRSHPGVLISDFILPAWFGQGFVGAPYDHAGHVTRPKQLLSGGYVSLWEGQGGWTQKQMQEDGALVNVVPDSQRVRSRG